MMRKILLAICCTCFLLSCQRYEKVKIIDVEMRRVEGTQKWAIYDPLTKTYLSEFVIDSFYPLGIDEVSYSEDMYIMVENGKEYLYDAAGQIFLFEKECYTLKKDDKGYVYAETESGMKYPLSNNSGLPEKCRDFLRYAYSFLYTLDGKHYGVYFDKIEDEYRKYKHILPDIYDRIIYVRNNQYINHFVVCKDGKWEVLNMKGESARVVKELRKVKIKAGLTDSDVVQWWGTDYTQWYINLIRSIPLGIDNKHIASMGTKCSHIGTKQRSAITIHASSNILPFVEYGIFSEADF